MKQTTISAAPPRYKLAAIIWIGLYPTTLLAVLTIGPVLSTLPLPLRTLVMTATIVPTMVYVVLPVVKHLFEPWLTSDARDLH